MTSKLALSLALCIFLTGCDPASWSWDALRPEKEQTPPAPVVEPFVVGSLPGVIDFTFTGRTQVSRADVKGVTSPCKDISIEWMCESGTLLKKGDPVMTFSTRKLLREIPAKRLQFTVAEKQHALSELRLKEEMDRLLEEKEKLVAELKVVRATLVAAQTIDQSQVALLKENLVLAERNAHDRLTGLKKNQELFDLGQIAKEKLLDAEVSAKLAQVATIIPRIEWEIAAGKIDRLAIANLKLRAKRLEIQLGLSEERSGNGTHGIESKIKALESKIAMTRKGLADEAKRSRRELHKAIRDSADHTPVTWIEILDREGSVLRKVSFQPSDATAPAGFQVDTGQPFTEDRGYGWDRDVSSLMVKRSDDGKETSGLAVIEQQAVWQCRLDSGLYKLRIGLGDAVDWDGPLVRVGEEVIFYEKRLKEGQYEVAEKELEISGDALAVRLGDTCQKAIRAPGRGIISFDHWLETGTTVRWTEWPIFYYSDPEQFRVHGRVHQDLVALLKAAPPKEPRALPGGRGGGRRMHGGARSRPTGSPGRGGGHMRGPAPAAPTTKADGDQAAAPDSTEAKVAEAKSKLASSKVGMTTPGGKELQGEVERISTQPVTLSSGKLSWFEREEDSVKDKIARQVFIRPPKEGAADLRLNETLECRCELQVPSGVFVLPGHLVADGGEMTHVRKAGSASLTEVVGFRIGPRFVALTGVGEADRLVPPGATGDRDRTEQHVFTGEVVPGERTKVFMNGRGWGRIKEMVADASSVEEGQLIITLYDPRLESGKEEREERRKKANQKFLEAAEERRLKNVQAGLDHRAKVIAERLARNKVRATSELDPLVITRAENDSRVAAISRDHRVGRFALLKRSGLAFPSRLKPAEYEAELAELEALRKRVALIAATRKLDWVATIAARAEWLDSVDALGLREGAMLLARQEEQVARMKARLELEQTLEGDRWERRFEKIKNIKANASGRIFYLKGFNDHTRTISVIQKNFMVWGGLPIAEILDMSKLSFRAELPEDLYNEVALGMKLTIEFEQLNHRRLEGEVSDLGKRFYLPKEAIDEEHGEQSVSSGRVFLATLNFSPPPDLQKVLTPGTKGRVHVK